LLTGKFDAPDRMFYSMNHCFNCVLSNHADVKELTPEFYNTKDFDFLINARGLQLGATQTGERVDDVVLPPWAKSPRDFLKKNRKALESEYVTKMLPRWIDLIFGCKSRGEAAKEADNLFHSCCYLGDADLSAMKTEHERFQAELQATEFGLVPDQLFVGSHPDRLPRPISTLEKITVDEGLIAADFAAARSLGDYDSSANSGKGETWELLDPPSNSSQGEQSLSNLQSSSSAVGALSRTNSGPNNNDDENTLSTTPPRTQNPRIDSTMSTSPKAGSQHNNSLAPVIRPSESGTGAEVLISGGGVTPDRNRNLPLSGTGDDDGVGGGGRGAFSSLESNDSSGNRIQAAPSYDSNNSVSPRHHHSAESIRQTPSDWDMKIIERRQIHGDAVSGCALALDNEVQLLATTSLDGGLMAHTVSLATHINNDDQSRRGFTGTLSRFSYITMSRGQSAPAAESKLTEYRKHSSRDPLACLALASDGVGGLVALAGGHDDVVLAYGINSACAVASVYSHRDAVTGLDLIPRSMLARDSALWLENSTHIMVSGSWDATVKVWSVTVARGETVSVNREPLAELFDADSSIVCVSAVSVEHLEPNGGLVIAAGCADGSFCVWNLHSDGGKSISRLL
jgi:hypothetical protein